MKTILAAILLLASTFVNAAPKFLNLEDDQAVRANNGTLIIKVRSDEAFTLWVDNMAVATIMEPGDEELVFTLYDVDRGTRLIRLVSSAEVQDINIHLLRTHK